MIELTPRQEMLVLLAGRATTAADIGCDHGRLSCAMVQRGIAKRVFATDISAPSLEKARQLSVHCELEQSVICCAGDGFSALPEQPDVCVISGMGANTICRILSHPMAKKCRLVLQPMGDAERLRLWLWEHGFCVLSEAIAQENERFYEILLATEGESEPYCFALPQKLYNTSPETERGYLERKLRLLEATARGKSPGYEEKRMRVKERLEKCLLQM